MGVKSHPSPRPVSTISSFLPDYPFLPRLSVKGRVYLQCPSCALITINRVVPGQSQIECYDVRNECHHRLYGFGMRIWPIRRGLRTVPVDHITQPGLREGFPVGEMFRWKAGEMAHQLVPGGPGLARELVRQVRQKAGMGGLMGLGMAFEQVVAEWGLELDAELT